MLVVKVEVWPRCEASERFEIARVGIINRGDSDCAIADYDVIGIMGRNRQEWLTHGIVAAHIRPSGWEGLVARALTQQQDGLLHPNYVQSVADLLRKG